MKIAGVVVLYNPGNDVMDNIKSYIDQIDRLYVVDNSDKKNQKLIALLKKDERIKYLDNHGNRGIATALNVGAIHALKEGYDYLLTMDQDSSASEGMVENLVAYISTHPDEKLGIISAYQKRNDEKTCYYLKDYEQVLVIMTSGNLLNLRAYKKSGRFLDKLFIDRVDNEYCLRLNKNGYKVIRANKAILYHNLGKNVKVAGMSKILHNHIRLYYIVRNSLYLCKKYEKYFPDYIVQFRTEMLRAVRVNLIYGDHKIKQICYVLRALFDYKCNRFGRVN